MLIFLGLAALGVGLGLLINSYLKKRKEKAGLRETLIAKTEYSINQA